MRLFSKRNRLIAALPRKAIVAEIGVQRGDFANTILRKAQPARLHLIDCWEQHHSGLDYPSDDCATVQNEHDSYYANVLRRFSAEITNGRVRVHRGYSVPVLDSFPDSYFDWVYLDANHSYEAVAAELASVLPKLKHGGIIAGHDYINTSYWRERNYGVAEAVHDFCNRHGWELIARTPGPGWDVNRTENPSFAIRQRSLPALWPAWRSWLSPVRQRVA